MNTLVGLYKVALDSLEVICSAGKHGQWRLSDQRPQYLYLYRARRVFVCKLNIGLLSASCIHRSAICALVFYQALSLPR